MIDRVLGFKSNFGLSAAVYAQITDVELERNGLPTYDRIMNPDVDTLTRSELPIKKSDLPKAYSLNRLANVSKAVAKLEIHHHLSGAELVCGGFRQFGLEFGTGRVRRPHAVADVRYPAPAGV